MYIILCVVLSCQTYRVALLIAGWTPGLSAIPCNHFAGLFLTLDTLTLTIRHTILSSRVDCYKYSFFPRSISDWNLTSKASIVSFRSALLKISGPVENFGAMTLWRILTKEPMKRFVVTDRHTCMSSGDQRLHVVRGHCINCMEKTP